MDFRTFRERVRTHTDSLLAASQLYVVDLDPDLLWQTYLESFPPEKNRVFRKNREHDCSVCRSFVKRFGSVVAIGPDFRLRSVWDFDAGDLSYQKVVEACRKLVISRQIRNIFLSKEGAVGAAHSRELLEGGDVRTWDHLHTPLPEKFRSEEIPTAQGYARDVKQVLRRSLEELTADSVIETLDLIAQKSLYRGEEWEPALLKFQSLQRRYVEVPEEFRESFCWKAAEEAGPVVGKIRNHSIGTLLQDLSKGVEMDEAVRKFEAVMAPTNYKRPKAIFTKKMVEQAEKTLQELGLGDSLARRHAILSDISINNVLFADRDARPAMKKSLLSELKKDVSVNPRAFAKLEEVPADRFLSEVLPTATSLEVLFEGVHKGNLVSLIAPVNPQAKGLFKWSNPFSWTYSGNIADSMKERVKTAGGQVEGALRFSIQWNDKGDNLDDLDAHCNHPDGHIYFSNKRDPGTRGALDVDIIYPKGVAVENIIFPDLSRMVSGDYVFSVHCYTSRGARSGFSAEIEFEGQIFSFSYSDPLKYKEAVKVATVSLDTSRRFKITESLDSSVVSQEAWGMKTGQFQPVETVLFSPNYWDGQVGVGNRHAFFMLRGCKNDTQPSGFFNEFLSEDLQKHKRVLEALSSKMWVPPSDVQLSGLGFATTQRNSVVVKVSGSFTRTLRVIF